jgi:tRNA (adenine22-N1)-methyltransferase
MDNGYSIVSEELLRENRFYYEIIVAERAGPVAYTAEQLYFGPLQMQARSPAFIGKWQRLLRQRQKTLASLEQARQAVPEQKVQEMARQVGWITALLA